MRKKQRVAITIVAVVAVAGVTSIMLRHGGDATTAQRSPAQLVTPQTSDGAIVKALQDANVRIDRLTATNVGGIVVLKGTGDAASAQQAATVVHQMGFARVANLIVTRAVTDDEAMRRAAERQLASTRSLDGCTLHVSCTNGILRVEGTSYSDLQSDVARNVLRRLGAQEVQVALRKL
jgi:fructose-1,6-bisphosphatase/sedoheptulose 1,7-bisphosphatase-like protein